MTINLNSAGITVENLTKDFGETKVLRSIGITAEPGEFVCLLGPSGCGKTTLLRCISGLEHPDGGRITVGDRTMVDAERGLFVPPEKRGLGMVFQQYALWPHMSAEQNIAYPLKRRGLKKGERREKVREIAEIVGLSARLSNRPRQLSGGEQQRTALARALVMEPPALLLDEPLSNLDATLRTQLRRDLRQLHDRLGTTTILVTHDQEEAAAVADKIVVVQRGVAVQIGDPSEILQHPQTKFVAEFVGFDNFIRGTIESVNGARRVVVVQDGQNGRIELVSRESGPAVGDTVLVAARSDLLKLSKQNGQTTGVSGTVVRIAPIGSRTDVEVQVGDQRVVAGVRTADLTGHQPGDLVHIDFPESSPPLPDAPEDAPPVPVAAVEPAEPESVKAR